MGGGAGCDTFMAEPSDLVVSSVPGFEAIHICTRAHVRMRVRKYQSLQNLIHAEIASSAVLAMAGTRHSVLVTG